MKLPSILLATVAIATPAWAVDPRIATLFYDPAAVTRVNGHVGIQSTIEFSPDEHIENVAVGNSATWQVTPNKHASVLFVKPVTPTAKTNMTVITDKRTYLFDLAASAKSPPVYVLRFSYPKPPASAQPSSAVAGAAPPGSSPSTVAPANLNFAWKTDGNRALLPSRMFDDGQSTWLQWPKDVQLPAILVAGPDGDEGPVNYSVHGDYVVLDGVPPQIILRRGKQTARMTPESRPQAPASHDAQPAKPAATPATNVADGRP